MFTASGFRRMNSLEVGPPHPLSSLLFWGNFFLGGGGYYCRPTLARNGPVMAATGDELAARERCALVFGSVPQLRILAVLLVPRLRILAVLLSRR